MQWAMMVQTFATHKYNHLKVTEIKPSQLPMRESQRLVPRKLYSEMLTFVTPRGPARDTEILPCEEANERLHGLVTD